MSRRRTRGFTLLELLVALAIFAVLGVLAYGGLRQVISLDNGLRTALTRHQRLELAMLVLTEDLRQAVPRGVRDGLGESEPALHAGLDGELLSLTRAAPDLPGLRDGAALVRVRYRLVDGALYRDVWARLDRTPGTAFRSRRLLEGVDTLALRFFADAAWSEFWPRADAAATADILPRGVEVAIAFDDGGEVRRVLARAG